MMLFEEECLTLPYKKHHLVMNTRYVIVLLCLLIASCTARKDAAADKAARPWKAVNEKLLMLRKEGIVQEALKLSHQELPRLVQAMEEETDSRDSLLAQARLMMDICYDSYMNARQYSAGLAFMDSLNANDIVRTHCPYELLHYRATFHQMMGDNEEAIRLADEYLALPRNPDKSRFIQQAEAISGVYIYCGNNVPQAIELLEQAIEAHEQGGHFRNMIRLISRLGIYYRLTGQYEKAAETNQKAIANYTDDMPTQNVVIAYGEQANLYGDLGMYEQALQMNELARRYSVRQDSFGLGDLYRYRAQLFRKLKKRDSVFHYLRLGEQASIAQQSFKGVFVNRVTTAEAYLDYPDSVQKALQLTRSICKDSLRMPPWAKAQLRLHMGRALMQSGDEAEGVKLIHSAARDFGSMGMLTEEYNANAILLDYYSSWGKKAPFEYYYERCRLFSDSLKQAEIMRAVAAANIRFDTHRKEEENKLLSAQLDLQKQRLSYNIAISVALCLLLMSFVAYYLFRRKVHRQALENNRLEMQRLISRQQELNRRNEQLNKQIEEAMASKNLETIRQLTVQSLLSKEDEQAFRRSFAALYPSYLPRLRERFPRLTRNEELLAMLVVLNQSTDEIALIIGINRQSVNVIRSRMRKNMGLAKEESLDEVLKSFL